MSSYEYGQRAFGSSNTSVEVDSFVYALSLPFLGSDTTNARGDNGSHKEESFNGHVCRLIACKRELASLQRRMALLITGELQGWSHSQQCNARANMQFQFSELLTRPMVLLPRALCIHEAYCTEDEAALGSQTKTCGCLDECYGVRCVVLNPVPSKKTGPRRSVSMQSQPHTWSLATISPHAQCADIHGV